MKYRAVFIDWDGTLSDSRFWERWKGNRRYELIQHHLFSSFENKQLVNDWMLGNVSHTDVIKYLSAVTHISTAGLLAELRYSAENMKLIDRSIPKKIQKLRDAGVKVHIATDNMDTFRLWTIPALGLENTFDSFLVSDSLKCIKKDTNADSTSSFFGQYLSLHHLSAKDTALIDNSPDTNIEQFGIDFLHVTRTTPLTMHLDMLLADLS